MGEDYIDSEVNDDYLSDGIELVDDEEDNVNLGEILDATPKHEPAKKRNMERKMIQKSLTSKHRAKGIKTIIIQTNDGKIIKFS